MKTENQNLQLVEAKLFEWRDKIGDLESKALRKQSYSDEKVKEEIDRIMSQYFVLENEIAHLSSLNPEEQNEAISRLEQSWDNLIQAFEHATRKFE